MARTQRSRPATPARVRRFRRGTVLLFALGVLAVISIAALSYVTLVRVDRQASSAVAKTVGYARQESTVIDTMGELIAADLFGNKIVTTDVPQSLNPGEPSDAPIWPTMFEDGEFRDYTFTNFATFNQNLPGKTSKNAVVNWVLALDQVAPPDDAWLAPLDPMWFQPGTNNDQSHWRQVTNLRSGYAYDTNGSPTDYSDDRWIRGDGKYVDLGQIFLDYRTIGTEKRGNPSTNLLDRSVLGNASPDGPVLPRTAAGNVNTAPFVTMNFASGNTGNPALEPRDERFWADTDGDLRADARWQIVDALGNKEGLLWVAAARIVDLSAMVNVNSSIEGGYPSSSIGDYAEGRTPADVDLYRLLLDDVSGENIVELGRRFNWDLMTLHGTPKANKLSGLSAPAGGTFSDHLINRLRVIDLTNELKNLNPNPSDSGFPISSNWYWEPDTASKRLSWAQRLVLWQNVGSAPGRGPTIETPLGPVRAGYSNTDMIDLHAFAGSNNRSMLTDLEETFDGPDDATGYLPRPEDQASSNVGPLRSRERPGDTRVYPSNIVGTDARPRADQLRTDPRRLLTTVSGVSDLSPVPVLNFKAKLLDGKTSTYYGQYGNRKVRLGSYTLSNVPEAFQAFVWALAPLATDEYLTASTEPQGGGKPWGENVKGSNLDLSPSYHYGGKDYAGGYGIPEAMALAGGQNSVAYGDTSGAAFSVLTAAALSLNLVDATDENSDPSVARFVVSNTSNDVLLSKRIGDVAYLSTRFSQGDIPVGLLPTDSVGQRVTQVKGLEKAIADGDQDGIDAWMDNLQNKEAGVTMVGAERTAYIGEVFAAGAFESTADPVIDLTQWADQAGAMLAVQMINPWKEEVDLSDFELVIMAPSLLVGDRDMSRDENLRFNFPAGSKIDAAEPGLYGERTFVYINYDPGKGGFPDAYKSVIGRDENDADVDPIDKSLEDVIVKLSVNVARERLIPADQTTRDYITANPAFIMMMRNGGGNERMTVVLRRKTVAGLSEPAVVDVLETDKRFFDYPVSIDIRDPAFGFVNNIPYFQAIGYTNVATPGNIENDEFLLNNFGGRVILTSSATRPIRNAGASSGKWFSYAAIQPLPDEVHVLNMSSYSSIYAHAWLYGIPAPAPLAATELVVPITTLPTGRRVPETHLAQDMYLQEKNSKTGADAKFADRSTGAGGWQLFIPNRPLAYVSELGEVSIYANTCKDNKLKMLDNWATVGQQLRGSIDWTFNPISSTSDNPYLGVLDFTRFLPIGPRFDDASANLTRDDSLALPLAARVFDCFEALTPADTLAQGRININTAPERVLQVLPLVAPGNSTVLPNTNDRARFVLQYRDAWDPTNGVDYFGYNGGTLLQMGQNIFGDFGIGNLVRRHDASHDPNLSGPNAQYPFTTGFSTAGELAFLEVWGNQDRGLINDTGGMFPQGFLYPIAINGNDEGSGGSEPLRVLEGEVGANAKSDDIVDDPEERLALYRAVSNIVSSRSDVYGAWFILRGYDPKQIEAIPFEIDTMPKEQALEKAMDDPRFAPAYESRWFVVFDRSNVRKPTDRPKVILKAQLPSSRP